MCPFIDPHDHGLQLSKDQFFHRFTSMVSPPRPLSHHNHVICTLSSGSSWLQPGPPQMYTGSEQCDMQFDPGPHSHRPKPPRTNSCSCSQMLSGHDDTRKRCIWTPTPAPSNTYDGLLWMAAASASQWKGCFGAICTNFQLEVIMRDSRAHFCVRRAFHLRTLRPHVFLHSCAAKKSNQAWLLSSSERSDSEWTFHTLISQRKGI